MTSHARLAEVMNMPCTCGHGQHHAKCEGSLAGQSAFYTPTYVRRVARVIGQEMSREGLVRELEGETSLLALFGSGPVCVCPEVQSHGSAHLCGHCLSGETRVGDPTHDRTCTIGPRHDTRKHVGRRHPETALSSSCSHGSWEHQEPGGGSPEEGSTSPSGETGSEVHLLDLPGEETDPAEAGGKP